MDHGKNVGWPQSTCVRRDPLKLQFDFVVTERSIYTPWSGPNVLEPTPVADHDRNGFIISEINNYRGNYMYIVTWKDKPHLLVSVRPQKIRDYVSARSYEEWNMQKFLAESRSLENVNSASGDENKEDEEKELKKKSKSERNRKRKRKPSEELKTNHSLQTGLKSATLTGDQDQPVLPLSRQASLISQSNQDLDQIGPNDNIVRIRPNYQITPFKANESGSQETPRNSNGIQTNQTTAYEQQGNRSDTQLKRYSTRLPRLKIESEALSEATSSDTNSAQESIPAKPRTSRSSSRSTILDSQQVTKFRYQDLTEPELQNSLNTSRLGSEASMSCNTQRDNDKINARNTKPRRSQNFVDSFFKTKPNSTKRSTRRKTMDTISQQKNRNDSGFEVEDIQDERWEQDRKGNGVLFYLIKWKGSHIKTWEPEENIGSDVLTKYTANKIARSEKQTRRSSVLRFLPSDIEDGEDRISHNNKQPNFNRIGIEADTIKTTRKAKQKAMAINMFEPEVVRRKRGGIPGDLGDEDEPFQVTSGRRRKSSNTKR